MQTYELKKLPPRDNVLETKLRDRIIPQVEFREADVRDVIQFFRESGRYRGVDQTWVDPPTEIVLLLTPAQAERVPKITLSAQTISMYDTIRIVADLTGLQFVIENGKVLLRMKK